MANAIPVHHDKLKPADKPQEGEPAQPAEDQPAVEGPPRGVPYKVGKAMRVDH